MEPHIPHFWQTSPSALEWTALILFLAWTLFGLVHFTYLKFKHGAEMPLDLRRYLVWRARLRARERRGPEGPDAGPLGPGRSS
jgi:hypothetical protein